MVEVLVEFDYTAHEPDELTIKKGDIIKDVIQKPGGWWEGTLHDKKGLFPDNFGKVLEKDVVLRSKRDKIRQCRVVFSYNQDHEDELNLKVGDVINIIGEEEEGWWRGLLNGKEGVFPSNFVEEITPVQLRPKPSNRDDLLKLTEPPLPAKPVKQLCQVRYSYKSQNDDELTLKEGDIISILNKDCQDAGWWKGEINGKVGVFPDNFVELLPLNSDDRKAASVTKVDSKSSTDTSAIKPSSVASERKSLEPKNAHVKPSDIKNIPPLPGKKPAISIKKSPSGSGSGLFSKLKDKIVDAVDGATSSKPKTDVAKEAKENNIAENANSNVSAFDQVERRPLLSDVRANRVRAPGRRLPTAIHKDDEDETADLPNGNVDHVKPEHSVKSEDSFKSEESVSSENLDISSELDTSEVKPKLREWEKHKAPWLEEMKLNQAKRTSVSPVSDLKTKPQPVAEPKPELEVSKSSHSSPSEKENNNLDMSKSMSDIKVSPVELKPIPKPYKTPPNEMEKDKAPPIKSKPVVSSLSSVNRHSIGSNPPPKESPSRPMPIPQQLKISSKPKPEPYETAQKNPGSLTSATGSYSSYSNSHTSHSSSFSTSEKTISNTSAINFDSSSSSSSNISPTTAERSEGVVSVAKFNEVLERLTKLESKCEKQGQLIENLKNRLHIETEMRMILQERIMHNNVQV